MKTGITSPFVYVTIVILLGIIFLAFGLVYFGNMIKLFKRRPAQAIMNGVIGLSAFILAGISTFLLLDL